MTVPVLAPFTAPSTVRQIAPGTTGALVGGASSGAAQALLVHEIGGGLAAGGAVGGQAIGQQVISAAANAASVVVGTMLVNAGSAVAGSVRNNSATPGVLTITDSAGRVLARVALPAGVTTAFNPTLYPLLGQAGALASADNDAAGNAVGLGQTPLGMQYPNASLLPGVSAGLVGWTFSANNENSYAINPAKFPFTLVQAYVDATDSLPGFAFHGRGTGNTPGHNMTPNATGDAAQKIVLFDPNGQPVPPSAYQTPSAYGGGPSGIYSRAYIPGGTLLPGWWTIVDNGQGNDLMESADGTGAIGYTPILGGGTLGQGWWIPIYQDDSLVLGPPTFAGGIEVGGHIYGFAGFNDTTRFQYQAATGLYRPSIQSLTFTATFPAVPNGGTIVISAAT